MIRDITDVTLDVALQTAVPPSLHRQQKALGDVYY